MSTKPFPLTKHGPAINPVGEYVRLHVRERVYLGEVTSCFRDETLGAILVTVKHFNGEPWPFAPALSALGWITQDGEVRS